MRNEVNVVQQAIAALRELVILARREYGDIEEVRRGIAAIGRLEDL